MENNKDYVLNNFKVFLTLPSMLNSIRKGEYKIVPIRTYLGIIVGILYLIMPYDLILDLVPIFGQIDDFLVLAIMLKIMAPEVTSYHNWKYLN